MSQKTAQRKIIFALYTTSLKIWLQKLDNIQRWQFHNFDEGVGNKKNVYCVGGLDTAFLECHCDSTGKTSTSIFFFKNDSQREMTLSDSQQEVLLSFYYLNFLAQMLIFKKYCMFSHREKMPLVRSMTEWWLCELCRTMQGLIWAKHTSSWVFTIKKNNKKILRSIFSNK